MPRQETAEVAPGIVSYPLRRYLLDESRGKRRDYWPFYYGVRFSALNVLAIDTDTVQAVTVDADAPFLWIGTLGRESDNAAAANARLNNATIYIRLGGRGARAFANTPVAWRNAIGHRPQPAMLPVPWLIPGGSEFHVTLRLQRVTTVVTAWVLFVGLKIYGWGPHNAT